MGFFVVILGLIVMLFGLYEGATSPVSRDQNRGHALAVLGMSLIFLGMFFVSNP